MLQNCASVWQKKVLKILTNKVSNSCPSFRLVSTTCLLGKAEDRKAMMASLPRKDEGIQGEKSVDIDSAVVRMSLFPDENTPNLLFDGIKYSDLPVCHIHVSRNNTIMTLTDSKGAAIIHHSCGLEGFKNTRKGTNIAAQATGISLSKKALERGILKVRVTVKGLGPGRMASVKGLQMGGMDVVSITDNSPITGPRPRKQRRL